MAETLLAPSKAGCVFLCLTILCLCVLPASGALSFRRLRELDFEYPGLTEALQFAQQQADALLPTLGVRQPVKTERSGLKLASNAPTAGPKPDKAIRLLAAQ